jgi:outer membrane protein assembly factor BamC
MSYFSKTVGWCLLVSVMGGCSTVDKALPDHREDYKKSTTIPSLEVPPDLIGSTRIEEQMLVPDKAPTKTATLSDSQQTSKQKQPQTSVKVLPAIPQVQIKRDGSVRWLVLQGEPETIWPKVKQFWLKNGFSLKIENPSIGIIETEWAEMRSTFPETGIRKYLNKALNTVSSASIRDKFRVRLERGRIVGTTELYLTHRGAEEIAKGDNFVWQGRPSDPALEAEMLNRFMVFIGIEQADSLSTKTAKAVKAENEKPISRANLTRTKEGEVNLIVQEYFARAWRRTGLALDRLGFTVEDRDRSRGVYFIRYIDPEAAKKDDGFFATLFGSKSTPNSPEYRISLKEETSTTRIVVLNSKGQIETSKTTENILILLHEQLQ